MLAKKTNPFVAKLGKAVRVRRLALGWSQRELGRRASLAHPQVHWLENGRSVPRWDSLARLLMALGLSLEIGGG